MTKNAIFLFLILAAAAVNAQNRESALNTIVDRPNVILIYADDLGYGDLSSYGATKIRTPHIDRLAQQGIRFTNAHSTSATCTPSRYALMTGEYPWRKGAAILPGDAALIIPEHRQTLADLFKDAGYRTAIVGKWHLGLGSKVEKDWNAEIKPGPRELGFDYSFIFPATADRVPTVFMENDKVLGLDPADPIRVDYVNKVGDDPTGEEHPELLKMKASPGHGHNQTIVNGIGRIGYMTGGQKARWVDEEVPLSFLAKARTFIEESRNDPFFLFFSLTEPHVPRMPSTMFKGKSGLGYRGDVILQLDWTVGEIIKQLEYSGIAKNTIVIFTSDNGPVLDDGYQDEAVLKLNGHAPLGPLRGGKYSAFEGGTRVPFILSWPQKVEPMASGAMLCQMDLMASISELIGQPVRPGEAPDSENTLKAFLGHSEQGRQVLVKQGGAFSITRDGWKYIAPSAGPRVSRLTGIETGNSEAPQLYNLKEDIGEKNNLAGKFESKMKEMAGLLEKLRRK